MRRTLTALAALLTLLQATSIYASPSVPARNCVALALDSVLEESQKSALAQVWNEAVQTFQRTKSYEPELLRLAKKLKNDKDASLTLFNQKVATVDLQVVEGKGLRVDPSYDPKKPADGIVVRVQLGREDANNPFQVARAISAIDQVNPRYPHLVLSVFPELNGYRAGQFPSFYDWITVFSDARRGDPAAQAQLRIMDANMRVMLLKMAKRSDVKSANFEGFQPSQIDDAQKRVNEAASLEIRTQKARLEGLIAKRQQEIQKLSSKSFSISRLESLVAKNDREGVAKLISDQLPWTIMSPSETDFWRRWLKSVRKPSRNRTLVYRGFGGEPVPKNKKGQVYSLSRFFYQEREPDPRISFAKEAFAPIRNSLSRYDYDRGQLLPESDRKDIAPLPTNVMDYLEGGLKKLSFNFSYDPHLSFSFATTGHRFSMAAFKIDRDRLMLNLRSPYVDSAGAEREIHAPLVIFPDELAALVEGEFENDSVPFRRLIENAAKTSLSAKAKIEDRDRIIVLDAVRRLAQVLSLKKGKN